MTNIVPVAYATMMLAALLLPTPVDRFRGAFGLPAFLLGVASLPYLPDFRGPSLTVWISGALLLLGPALLALAAWRARSRLTLRHPAPWLALAGVTAGLAAAWPTLDRGGPLPAALTAGVLGFGSLLVWMVGEVLGVGRALRWLDHHLPALRGRQSWGTPLFLVAALLFHLAWYRWPLWVLSWQPSGVGIAVLGLAWAAATRRPSLALAAVAFATSFAAPETGLGGWTGWIALAIAALGDRSRPRVIAVISAFGAYLVWPVLLGEEVLLTVLLTAAAAALLAQLATQSDREVNTPR
ncbi:MAG: hypothetical protein R2910_11925 [Gemmatimonadales bacterium]